MQSMQELAFCAKKSASGLALCSSTEKNKALYAMADALEQQLDILLEHNQKDLDAAEENGMSAAMVDRLRLDADRIRDIAESTREIAGLQDPTGRILDGHTAANGLQISRVTVPLGVVGIIYESRPNVTVDCAALCLKAGNACILRGGSEAIHSNRALAGVLRSALESVQMDPDVIQLVEDTSREAANQMMRMDDMIDVLIPRGGKGLIDSVVQNATVPIIKTGTGNCHLFVDASGDPAMAANIVDNAKTSRPSVCNALETLLVHNQCAETVLPLIANQLAHANVELRGCEEACRLLPHAVAATEEDYATEFSDFILAIKVVADLQEAIEHIARYSTHHSDAIITENMANARAFTAQVDSAAVYVNASTRFTDGGIFGLGAEIGISTQKLHARGPMGLTHLTTYKYVVTGQGQIR